MAIAIMKGILWFFCIFILLFGVLFAFFPGSVVKMNAWGNKVLFAGADPVLRHTRVGAVLLTIGVIILIILFTL